MCPIDPSPVADDVMNMPEARTYPPFKDKPEHDNGDPDIAHRPSLPEHPEQMAVDVEDEEDDPVIDSGPGIADGV